MKKILLYSSDFTMNFSLLMYLKDKYNVTVSMDDEDLSKITKCIGFDLILLDMEPSANMEKLCEEIKAVDPHVPIVLIYVYKNQNKEFDINIRKFSDIIFYKPFDLNELTKELSVLTGTFN
jgi:DNA-binding response OmpR family regulator